MYFSVDNTQMLEVLRSEFAVKALLYEGAELDDNYVEWRLVRKLENYPYEFMELSLYPFYFSPCF